jgi:hypothetical protein
MIPTISTFEKLKSYYSEPQYTFLWVYGNHVLIRENKLDGNWLFFVKSTENLCRLLVETKDFESGNQEAEKFWNQKDEFKSAVLPITSEDVHEQIVNALSGFYDNKKAVNNFNQVTESSMCLIYWGVDSKWHCFVPTIDALLGSYKESNQTCPFLLEFLEGDFSKKLLDNIVENGNLIEMPLYQKKVWVKK